MILHRLSGSVSAAPKSRLSRRGSFGLTSMTRRVAALSCVLGLAGARALEIPYDYHVPCTPENAIFGFFSPTKKPVLTVKSGAVVKIDGGGGNKWRDTDDPDMWLKANNVPITVESSPALQEIV